jgi:hypothetical protein
MTIVNVPSMASAWTFVSGAVVIIRRCTSEMSPLGEQHNHIRLRTTAKLLRWRLRLCHQMSHHDRGAFGALMQHMIHQPGNQLASPGP